MSRVTDLEKRVENMQTKQETKEMVNEKIDPVYSDLQEIKSRIDKIFDHLLNQNND